MGVTDHYHIYLSFSNKKYLWPFNIKLNPNTALRRTVDGRASFYNARLFFVVLGVQNWVPIEHGHIYRIINTSDNTTQRNVKTTHRTSAEKIFWTQICLFCCCFFSFNFFWVGRGLGLGLFFLFFLGGGAGIQRNATLTQSIALRSAIVGRENLIAGGLFVLFFCLFVFFCFYFIFIIFSGEGVGWAFLGGGGRGIDYPNYAPSTVSQKILAQFRFRFVLLFVVV